MQTDEIRLRDLSPSNRWRMFRLEERAGRVERDFANRTRWFRQIGQITRWLGITVSPEALPEHRLIYVGRLRVDAISSLTKLSANLDTRYLKKLRSSRGLSNTSLSLSLSLFHRESCVERTTTLFPSRVRFDSIRKIRRRSIDRERFREFKFISISKGEIMVLCIGLRKFPLLSPS